MLDLAALFVLVGLGLAVYRRYVVKPDRLNTDWRFNFTLPLLAFIILTGLLVEALRLAAMQPAWAPFSVVGYPLSLLFGGLSESVLLGLHRGCGSFTSWPSRLPSPPCRGPTCFHIFTSPANIFVAPFRARARCSRSPTWRRPSSWASAADRPPVAAAGQPGCLHRMRALPGRLPGLRGGAAAQTRRSWCSICGAR